MESNVSSPVSIYALGGLGEVGKNMYCIENDKTIIIIDAGVKFPGTEFPGIDYIVPDFTHLKNNRHKVKALFVTHGHEDHIGGIPFLLQHLNIPFIYAPALSAALINNKLDDSKISHENMIKIYDDETTVTVDSFKVSFFRVTHSIPDSFGIVVDTNEGRIVSTGDFKVDLTPIGKDIALNKMAKIGLEGIDLLLSDSTNAEKEGYTPSEKNVFDSINDIIKNAPGRLIVSTFASNLSRISQICEASLINGRKITIVGRSMEKAVEIARGLGYIKVPDNILISASDIKQYKNNQILILCTGSQGEPMAALSRITSGEHKDIHIMPGDTVVFSSSPIPGNGVMIEKICNQLARCGAEVITNSILSDIHSSGHASKQELRLVLKIFNPRHFMPMHGDYRMLLQHADLAVSLGMDRNNVFVLENGDSLTLTKGKVKRGYPVDHGSTFIDGNDINGLAEVVMQDRRLLTENGMLTVAVVVDTKANKLMLDPEIIPQGLIFRDDIKYYAEIAKKVRFAIEEKLKEKTTFSDIKLTIKDTVGQYMYKVAHSKAIVIPVVMEYKK